VTRLFSKTAKQILKKNPDVVGTFF